VIAIIAILVGLLFPMLSSARQRAYAAQCASNLRQWGVAFNTFMEENDGVFPEVGADADGILVLGATNAWFNLLAPHVGEKSLYQRAVDYEKQPRPGDKSVYICPAEAGSDMTGITDEFADPFMCYGCNLWVSYGERASDSHSSHPDSSGFGFLLRLSQLLKPSRFVVLSEIAGKRSSCHAPFLSYRHRGGQVNLLFADGHVATMASNAIHFTQQVSKWKSYNKGGIIWDPEGNPPQTDASF
jgi:prepilin-type processing-associated H-X9-DG protein